MGAGVSGVLGFVLLAAWAFLILVRHAAAGWPHALYAVGVLLIIRWIVLRDANPEALKS